jgi:hypothetical protein
MALSPQVIYVGTLNSFRPYNLRSTRLRKAEVPFRLPGGMAHGVLQMKAFAARLIGLLLSCAPLAALAQVQAQAPVQVVVQGRTIGMTDIMLLAQGAAQWTP